MKLTKIPITQECIDNGERNSLTRCPVALAIRTIVNGNCIVCVGQNHIFVTLNYETQHWPMEEWLSRNIQEYDNTGAMSEFDIYLPLDRKYLR